MPKIAGVLPAATCGDGPTLCGRSGGRLRRAQGKPTVTFQKLYHSLHTMPRAQACHNIGSGAACALSVSLEQGQIDADIGGKVGLVNHQQVRTGDRRTALAGDLLALADADHIDRQVGEVRGEGGRQVVAAALDKDDVKVRMTAVQIGDSRQAVRAGPSGMPAAPQTAPAAVQ